jgi:curved DNA-binding protein CbpA
MGLDSKIFDSIRTRRKKPADQASDEGPKCHWDGCEKKALHRAPVGREAEGEFFLFCLEHVKEYNKGYNYMSGLSSDEIARYQKEAATGTRPTWGMGVDKAARDSPVQSRLRSGAYAHSSDGKRAESRGRVGSGLIPAARKLKPLEAKAFETLQLKKSAAPEEIKSRYKELLKLHHPDTNEGNRGSEEQLQSAIQAHKLLKQSGFC